MTKCLNNMLKERATPMASFIVTCADMPAELIRDSVRSIVSLTLSIGERQIIVVDYGTGASPINDLGDISDEILYVRLQAKNLSAARNAGLRMASGTFIQLVRGGDVLNMAHYNHCLDIARYMHPDMVMFRIVAPGDIDKSAIFKFVEPMAGIDYMRDNDLRADACGYIFSQSLLGGLRLSETDIANADGSFTPAITKRAKRLFATEACACLRREEQRQPSLEEPQPKAPPHADATSKTLRKTLHRRTPR